MAVIMFGAMCRYDDASGLRWRNIRFVEDGSGFEITFEKRKNAQYRQGNKVLVASCPGAVVCPMRLLRQLRVYTGGSEELHVFRGFNGRLVAKNPGSTTLGPDKIPYDQMLRFMGLWFSGVLGTSVALFKKQWATQSGRSGRACFRGCERRHTGGALGPARRLAFNGGPEGVHGGAAAFAPTIAPLESRIS